MWRFIHELNAANISKSLFKRKFTDRPYYTGIASRLSRKTMGWSIPPTFAGPCMEFLMGGGVGNSGKYLPFLAVMADRRKKLDYNTFASEMYCVADLLGEQTGSQVRARYLGYFREHFCRYVDYHRSYLAMTVPDFFIREYVISPMNARLGGEANCDQVRRTILAPQDADLASRILVRRT